MNPSKTTNDQNAAFVDALIICESADAPQLTRIEACRHVRAGVQALLEEIEVLKTANKAANALIGAQADETAKMVEGLTVGVDFFGYPRAQALSPLLALLTKHKTPKPTVSSSAPLRVGALPEVPPDVRDELLDRVARRLEQKAKDPMTNLSVRAGPPFIKIETSEEDLHTSPDVAEVRRALMDAAEMAVSIAMTRITALQGDLNKAQVELHLTRDVAARHATDCGLQMERADRLAKALVTICPDPGQRELLIKVSNGDKDAFYDNTTKASEA